MIRIWITRIFIAMLLLLQFPLWFGKGGWLYVVELRHEIEKQRATNLQWKDRNSALDAEVRDLKTGYDAIEERARSELDLIKDREIFIQVPVEGSQSQNGQMNSHKTVQPLKPLAPASKSSGAAQYQQEQFNAPASAESVIAVPTLPIDPKGVDILGQPKP